MLFHVGALWRLNEAGYLPKLERVSSVSGGSITAGVLGLAWPKLGFDESGVAQAFQAEVVEPLRKLAGKTIDFPAIAIGLITPGTTIGERVAAAYRKHLFDRATLQDLPDKPRFVFNATNIQSGALWRFAKPYMRDYRVGEVKAPQVDVATAVAASSAFPPFSARRPEARRGCVHAGIGRAAARAVHDPAVSDGRWRLRQPRPRDDLGAVRDDPDLGTAAGT